MQRIKLEPANQISDLVERPVTPIKRSPHFRSSIIPLVPDAIDQKVDTLLWRHLFQVKAERKNYPRATMHAPEKHADAILGRLWKFQIPEEHLPVERAAFRPKGRPEQAAIRFVTRVHVTLEMVSGNQFMKDC